MKYFTSYCCGLHSKTILANKLSVKDTIVVPIEGTMFGNRTYEVLGIRIDNPCAARPDITLDLIDPRGRKVTGIAKFNEPIRVLV